MPSQIRSEHVRNIALDIVFTLLSCGLFNIYVNYVQMQAVNHMLKEQKYNFVHWILLTLITCGLYHIYHEYRKSTDIDRCMGKENSNEAILNVALTAFGLFIVADAIQQVQINRYYGSNAL